MRNIPLKRERGYTLLELIVSVGIFSIIMLIVTSAYLMLIHLDRKARATSDVITNLTFVVESMSREIRTGTNYRCNTTGTNCTSGGTSFRYSDSRSPSRTITYALQTNAQTQKGQVMVTVDSGTPVTSSLTDPRVDVNVLTFYVRGVGTADSLPPHVTFVMQGSIEPEPGEIVEFSLQGSATQRLLELP